MNGLDARQPLLLLVIGFASLGALLLAPAASASTVSTGGALIAAPGEQNVINLSGTSGAFVITDTVGVTAPGTPCTQDTPTQVSCPFNSPPMVYAGDLDDRLTTQATLVGLGALYFYGEAGNDTLDASASPSPHGLDGGDGNDTITGGERQDLVWGGLGDDTIFGRGGKDFIKSGDGADVIDAGEGNDLVMTLADPPSVGGAVGPGGPSLLESDDNVVDTVTCGGNTPGPTDIDNPNIPPTDTAEVGVGDLVAADCEEIVALVICPSGGTCSGVPEVTGPGGGASSSLASAAKAGKRPKGSNVLGRGKSKVKIRGGETGLAYVQMDRKKVRKSLRRRDQIPASLQLASGKGKGKASKSASARKIRFKLKK